MHADLLIEENNKKRKLLTKENEEYYDDLLVYIRLHFTLSEQQSEEVLMEMLTHLIEGQEEGKGAEDIFGTDPLAYTNEIIHQLPKEKSRNIFPFIGGIIVDIVSWTLMIRGIVLLIFSQFVEVNYEISLVGAVIFSLVIGTFTVTNMWYIVNLIKRSLFKVNKKNRLNMLKAGLFAASSMAIVLLIVKFTPQIGPSIYFSWWASLVLGAILWVARFIVKKSVNRISV